MENSKDSIEIQQKKFDEVNSTQLADFEKVPIADRILFTPHCLRKDFQEKIENLAKEIGYRVVKAGGGSIVRKTIEEEHPKAVIGVACLREIDAIIGDLKLPFQSVMLTQDGCKDTAVDIEKLEKIMRTVIEPE